MPMTGGLCFACLFWMASAFLPLAYLPSEQALRALEQEMSDHPSEALRIARRALDAMPGRGLVLKRLFKTAARIQEKRLVVLREVEVVELASVYEKTLLDANAARQLRRSWLKSRERALGPADAAGHLALARLYFGWLNDRERAAQLCQEALRIQDDCKGAEQLLQETLEYQKTDAGWVPKEKAVPRDLRRDAARVRIGMRAEELRNLLGQPGRKTRQILHKRYREQWHYDSQGELWIELDCVKGQDARVVGIHTRLKSSSLAD